MSLNWLIRYEREAGNQEDHLRHVEREDVVMERQRPFHARGGGVFRAHRPIAEGEQHHRRHQQHGGKAQPHRLARGGAAVILGQHVGRDIGRGEHHGAEWNRRGVEGEARGLQHLDVGGENADRDEHEHARRAEQAQHDGDEAEDDDQLDREHGFGRQGVEARHQIGKHLAPFLGDRDDSPGEPKGFKITHLPARSGMSPVRRRVAAGPGRRLHPKKNPRSRSGRAGWQSLLSNRGATSPDVRPAKPAYAAARSAAFSMRRFRRRASAGSLASGTDSR